MHPLSTVVCALSLAAASLNAIAGEPTAASLSVTLQPLVGDGGLRGLAIRRSLDDLILELKARETAGKPVTPEVWEAAVRRELGARGTDAFRAMPAGTTPLPGSDAFGPCFRRVSRQLRRYDLGFERKVLTESPRIVLSAEIRAGGRVAMGACTRGAG